MAASSKPPEEQPQVKQFDPLVLDRAVIAIPLLPAARPAWAGREEASGT